MNKIAKNLSIMTKKIRMISNILTNVNTIVNLIINHIINLLWNSKFDFCLNSDMFIFLINWMFITKQMLHLTKHRIFFNIKIRNIKIKIHDNLKYIFFDFFFQKQQHKEIVVIYIKTKCHLIDNFKIKMFIKMNIMKFEQIILNFDDKILQISICQNMKIFILFHRKKIFINWTIKIASQIIISNNKIVIISIRIKKTQISKTNVSRM